MLLDHAHIVCTRHVYTCNGRITYVQYIYIYICIHRSENSAVQLTSVGLAHARPNYWNRLDMITCDTQQNMHTCMCTHTHTYTQRGDQLVAYHGHTKKALTRDDIKAPDGWIWNTDWKIDKNRAVNGEGECVCVCVWGGGGMDW